MFANIIFFWFLPFEIWKCYFTKHKGDAKQVQSEQRSLKQTGQICNIYGDDDET